MSIEEKSKEYAKGKALDAMTAAIEQAYADGYNDGLKHFENEKIERMKDGVDYKDLGLTSKTLWSSHCVMDKEEYIKRWEAVKIPPSYFDPDLPEFFTERGEQVRSKSEKIIADKYYMIGIPYRYEQPLILLDRGKRVRVRPDFTVLNMRTRVQRFHEHLGRMDDPKYINKNIYKLRL